MIKQFVESLRQWGLSSPLRTFLYIFLFSLALFVLSQLVLHPQELLDEPWQKGGLQIALPLSVVGALIGALYIQYKRKRKDRRFQ